MFNIKFTDVNSFDRKKQNLGQLLGDDTQGWPSPNINDTIN